jgi:nucleosome assembly protein 1-like 1
MPEEAQLEKKGGDEGGEEEKDMGEKMDADYEMGTDFKDQLVPLALEYYLEVIEEESEDEDACDSDDDHKHGKGGHDSDDSDHEKPAKGGKKKGGKKGGKEGEKQECKQQ